MEILFENSYVRDKALAKEIYGHFYFRRKFAVVCGVFILLCLAVNILTAVFYGEFNWMIFVIVPVYFLLWVLAYFSQVNAMVKRDAEMYDAPVTVETVVTDEYIQNTASTGSVNKLEYDKIKKGIQTKNLILLHTKANLVYIFRKDTFTKGSKDEFIAFLKQKGVKIK